MGWRSKNESDDTVAGRAAGEGDAAADRKAGGFGKGGTSHPPRERSEDWTAAYDKAYTTNAPRSWRS